MHNALGEIRNQLIPNELREKGLALQHHFSSRLSTAAIRRRSAVNELQIWLEKASDSTSVMQVIHGERGESEERKEAADVGEGRHED
jgi:hypothetical protein